MASFLKKVGNFLFGTPDKVKTQELSAQQAQLNAAIGEEAGRYGDYMSRIKSLYDFTPQEQRMVGEQSTKVMGQQQAAQRAQLGSLLSKRPGGLQGAVNYLLAQQSGAQRAQGDALGKLYANLAMQRKQMQQQGLLQEMAAGTNRVRLLSGLQSPTQYIEKGKTGILGAGLQALGAYLGAKAGSPQAGAAAGAAVADTLTGRQALQPISSPQIRTSPTLSYSMQGQSGLGYGDAGYGSWNMYARGGAINRGAAGLMGEAGRETVVTGHGKFTVDRPTIFMSMAKGSIIPQQQGRHGIKGKHAGRAGAAAATGMHMGMKSRRSQGWHGFKGQAKRQGA